jgi:hypothetical protein
MTADNRIANSIMAVVVAVDTIPNLEIMDIKCPLKAHQSEQWIWDTTTVDTARRSSPRRTDTVAVSRISSRIKPLVPRAVWACNKVKVITERPSNLMFSNPSKTKASEAQGAPITSRLARTDRKELCLPGLKSCRAIETSMMTPTASNTSSLPLSNSKLRTFPDHMTMASRSNSKLWNSREFNISLRKERPSHKEKFPQLVLKCRLGNNKEMPPKLGIKATRIKNQLMRMKWTNR